AALAIQRAMADEPWPERVALRVRVAVHAGGDPAGAVVVARAGQAAARRMGESNSDAFATWALCLALADHGRPGEALHELALAEELFARRPGHITEMSVTSARTYVLCSIEDDVAAASAASYCIAAGSKVGIPFVTVYGQLALAAIRRRAADVAGAAAALTEADEAVAQRARYFMPDAALEWARLWRVRGEPDRAEEQAHAALLVAVEMGFRCTVVRALEELVHLGASAGSSSEAARLLGACRSAREAMGVVPTKPWPMPAGPAGSGAARRPVGAASRPPSGRSWTSSLTATATRRSPSASS
ncbi:MAG: hypothetical protein ACRDYF_11160, partial [Acidimicrobiia bacterium]